MTGIPPLAEATRVWAKIGILSFGGPAAQIALMHKEVVEDRGWLSERQYLNALNFCMLLPGPEAMQLATYAGWRLHGTLGGLVAGLCFVLPGALVILVLASIYAAFGSVPLVSALFLGVKATVLVIVIQALFKVSKKALNGKLAYLIAALAFVGIFFLSLPYPLIVLGAGLIGWFAFQNSTDEDTPAPSLPLSKSLTTIASWLLIWWLPIAALILFGAPPLLSEIALFFSKLAVVTFGGAYAVLAYMAQEVVGQREWLTAGEMLDGLGLAETTPGPLILVTEFVGFMAGEKFGGWWMGFRAACVTLWVTFVPCFLWIFTGAPYLEWISAQPRLSGALRAITAAVVGVILNLSIWFSLHVLFDDVAQVKAGWITLWSPDFGSINPLVLGLAMLAAFLILVRKWNVIWVLGLSAIIAASVVAISA